VFACLFVSLLPFSIFHVCFVAVVADLSLSFQGILILSTDINSTLLDGVSALIICCLIIIGGIGSSYFWIQEVRQDCKEREVDEKLITKYENAEAKEGHPTLS